MITSYRFPLGIRGRLTLWFVLAAVGALVIGGIVVYATGVASIQGTLGQTYCQIASRIVGQVEERFRRETAIVQNIATDVLTTEVLLEWGDAYRNRPEQWIAARLDGLEKAWRAAGDETKRLASLHPQLSNRLGVLAGLQQNLVRRFSVYDLYGVIVAASAQSAHRIVRNQSWFKAVSKMKTHFIYLELISNDKVLSVVTPVWGGVDIVGYVVADYESALIAEAVDNIQFGDSGKAVLVDHAGVPLQGTPHDYLIQAMSRRPAAASDGAARGGGSSPYWIALEPRRRWPLSERLACVAPVELLNAYRSDFQQPPWSVIVTQAPNESYKAVERPLRSFALAGVVGIFVIGLGGAFIAWHIALPLKELQSGVQRFAHGDRNELVKVSSTDEIGELASEFNRMAERVAASEAELQAFAKAVEEATDAIVMTTPDGAIYYANPAFEANTGYAFEEVKGQTPSFLRDPEENADTYAEMWKALTDGHAWRGNLWNRRRDGEVYPVDLSISPVHDEHGHLVSLLGIHRDITLAHAYQQRLEKEVEEHTREIAETQGLAVTGRMASMIAHDLRNALSTIKMNLQILLQRHQDQSEAEHEHCRMGLDQVHYMEEILRDMLSYARPEKLQTDWHDLSQILDETLVGFLPLFEDKGIIVDREDTKALPKVYCDRVKVIAVLRNLVENALLAMPGGGRLALSAHILMDSPESAVRVEVCDNGVGIPEDALAEVFEPFFTTRTKGTGLGLAIVKRIVEQHGGEISIDSDQGRGTRVAFTLPTFPNEI